MQGDEEMNDFGSDGKSATKDPTIPKDRSGHPVRHEFTRAIPSSTCMVCHMHQPNVFVNTYYGTIMWDYESDAPFMWPEKQRYPSAAEQRKSEDSSGVSNAAVSKRPESSADKLGHPKTGHPYRRRLNNKGERQ